MITIVPERSLWFLGHSFFRTAAGTNVPRNERAGHSRSFYTGCWSPGNAMIQGFNNHATDLVIIGIIPCGPVEIYH